MRCQRQNCAKCKKKSDEGKDARKQKVGEAIQQRVALQQKAEGLTFQNFNQALMIEEQQLLIQQLQRAGHLVSVRDGALPTSKDSPVESQQDLFLVRLGVACIELTCSGMLRTARRRQCQDSSGL